LFGLTPAPSIFYHSAGVTKSGQMKLNEHKPNERRILIKWQQPLNLPKYNRSLQTPEGDIPLQLIDQ